MSSAFIIGISTAAIALGICIYLIILLVKRKQLNFGLIVIVLCLFTLASLTILFFSNGKNLGGAGWGIAFFCMMGVPAGFCVLVLEYTKRNHYIDPINVITLLLGPAIIQISLWTHPLHGIFWQPVQGNGSVVAIPYTFWSWVISLYCITTLFYSDVLLMRLFLLGSRPYRKQSGLLTISTQITIIIIAAGIFYRGFHPDLLTYLVSYTVLGIAITINFINFHLFNTTPISRDLILDRILDGFLVLDAQNRIVDINPAAEAIVNVSRKNVYGQPVENVLGNWDKLAQNHGATAMDFNGMLEVNHEMRYYSVRSSPLIDHRSKSIGRVIIWRDITERKKLEDTQQRARDEMFVLIQSISSAASESSDWRDFLTHVLYPIVYSFHSQIGAILIAEGGNHKQEFHASGVSWQGIDKENIDSLTTYLESKEILPLFYQYQKYLLLSDSHSDQVTSQILRNLGISSLLLIPFKLDDDMIGIIGLGRDEKLEYSVHEIEHVKVVADEVAAHVISERQRQQRITLTERKRLVQDLHDSITQKLYGLISHTQAVRIAIQNGSIGQIPTMIGQVEESARVALKEMRLFLFEATPLDIKREGLAAVIARRLASVEGRADVDARLITDGKFSLSIEKQIALYYIIQEALNNTLRHSKAKVVRVNLSGKRKFTTLEISDDGVGFSTKDAGTGGMGLKNIRERANQIDAKLKIISNPGKGTAIKLTIPNDRFGFQEVPGK